MRSGSVSPSGTRVYGLAADLAAASAIASGSGSTETSGGASRAAASGSLSPCPVTTQTTRRPRSSGRAFTAAVGEGEDVRRSVELLGDLEGRRLLSLDPERVQGIDQDVGAARRQLPRGVERRVEAASHLEYAAAERPRLGELPRGDGPGRRQ